jgi:hypothetical protein
MYINQAGNSRDPPSTPAVGLSRKDGPGLRAWRGVACGDAPCRRRNRSFSPTQVPYCCAVPLAGFQVPCLPVRSVSGEDDATHDTTRHVGLAWPLVGLCIVHSMFGTGECLIEGFGVDRLNCSCGGLWCLKVGEGERGG